MLANENLQAEQLLPTFKPQMQTQYLQDGELREGTQNFQQVYSPIRSAHLGQYPLMDETEIRQALKSSEMCFAEGHGKWPNMSISERLGFIEELIKELRANRDEFVQLLMWEIAKPFADSCKEVDRTFIFLEATLKEALKLEHRSHEFLSAEGHLSQIRYRPLGIVLVMGPYNYPFNETLSLLIPAIIMGNVAMVKPPKKGVLIYGLLQKIFQRVFPKGVINLVYGRGSIVVPTLIKTGKVAGLALIGSNKTAIDIRKLHPEPHRLKCLLGLDAKNPAIVTADADLTLTINEAVSGALAFNGQRCTALKMFFVQDTICDIFLAKLVQRVDCMKMGLPWEEKVEITPLADPDQIAHLHSLLNDALSKGARVLNKNFGPDGQGFFRPTILYPVNPSMRVYNEEQFGPLIPVLSFSDTGEFVNYVTQSHFGQQVSIFSNNANQVSSLLDSLSNQVSRINLNSVCQRGPDFLPFEGRKNSGEGTISIQHCLTTFTARCVLSLRESSSNRQLVNNVLGAGLSVYLKQERTI